MGTVIRDLTKDYKGIAKSWYDNTFKVLVPIKDNNVIFHQSYMRMRGMYKNNINLSGVKIKFNLSLSSNPGSELTETQVFSGYDYENKIKLDIYLQKESSSSLNMNIRIVYSTISSTTIFSYTHAVSSNPDLRNLVFQFTIDTENLTANGTSYSRYSSPQLIKTFTFSKTKGSVIQFNSSQSVVSVGMDAVELSTKLSEYGRMMQEYLEIDNIPRFNITFTSPIFITGTIVENVSREFMIVMGGNYSLSQLPITIEACNVHNG